MFEHHRPRARMDTPNTHTHTQGKGAEDTECCQEITISLMSVGLAGPLLKVS